MPNYAWKCKFCSYTLTQWKAFADEWIIPICPECDAEMIRDYRIAAVYFKGDGWAGKK